MVPTPENDRRGRERPGPHIYPRERGEDDAVDTSVSPYHDPGFKDRRRGVGDDVGDPGLVEPYGTVDADRDAFHLNEEIWVCASCGYQLAGDRTPESCPNCAATGEFVEQEM